MLITFLIGLANLAIDLNATPQFPIAEDRHPYRNNTTLNATPQFSIAEDRHPYRNNTLTPVRTHQPPAILQANVGQLYHFPVEYVLAHSPSSSNLSQSLSYLILAYHISYLISHLIIL